MKTLALVALGGGFGSACRYLVSIWLLRSASGFPLATFAVNLLGCLLIGIFAGLAARHAWLNGEARLLLVVGVLGGFTTFSAFGLDGMQLLRRGEYLIAVSYIGGSVIIGLGAVWLGWWLVDSAGKG